MFVMGFLGQSANAGEIHVESMVEEPCDASAEHGFRVEVPEEPLLERPEVDMVPELHEEGLRGIVEARLVPEPVHQLTLQPEVACDEDVARVLAIAFALHVCRC